MSPMPIRNVGSETPTSDTPMTARAVRVPLRMAVSTPRPIPPTMANRAAASDSATVAGTRAAMTDSTGSWKR